MSPRARTSFVIASRNRRPELSAVVDRLLDTTGCPVIVVDNASQDDSVAVLRRIAARAGGRLTVIDLPNNAGAVARNVGVAACWTPYVAFCDDDSWWAPQAVELAETIFDTYPTVALLAARAVLWPTQRDDPLVSALAGSPLGHDPALPGPSILGFLAFASIVRTSAFEAVGGFSSILHFRGEEQLLAWDLAAAGWNLCFCPALVAYHQPSEQRPAGAVARARNLRNATLSAWLRRPPGRCAAATVALARAAFGDVEHARALREAIAAVPAVLRARHRLPDAVERSIRVLERC